MSDTATLTPSAAREQRDAILAEIRAAGRLPDWCWAQIEESVARFDTMPEVMSRVGLSYAKAVRARGERMFTRPVQASLMGGEVTPPDALHCSDICGGASGEVEERQDGPRGRRYRSGHCRRCGQHLIAWLP